MASSSVAQISATGGGQGSDSKDYLWVRVRPLYRATLRGDWDEAKRIIEQQPTTAYAPLASTLETPLHIAVGTGKAIHFVENLVDILTDDHLALESQIGFNALHIAAVTGNTAAACILIARLPKLLYMPDDIGNFPIHIAAINAQMDTLQFLISQTKDDEGPNPYAGEIGARLLIAAIKAGFLDIAINLADKYPHTATTWTERYGSALGAISRKKSAFYSGARFNFWERFIYRGTNIVPIHRATATPNSGDIEDPACTALLHCGFQKWYKSFHDNVHYTLCKFIKQLVPNYINKISEKKTMHQKALQLVKCLCKHLESLTNKEATSVYSEPLLIAAGLGIHEVVEVIVQTFPEAIFSRCYNSGRYIFHVAVQNRCEKVWNLIYQASGHRCQYLNNKDAFGNSLLHLAATLAPPHKLNLVAGAALQMQREIQWFKEVEKWLPPSSIEEINNAGKTPKMIFIEEHMNLKAEGEKWMKDTANSCIAAALIATVAFAAAISVPGGNESNTGYPLFSKSSAFVIFAISDAICLFTSTTSLLMFLSILTSRYAEEDFLYALPKRFCIGLVTLFVSISFMTAAFSATIFLVFGRKQAWVLIPVAALAYLPVSSVVQLQFPLLVDIISSTYGPRIFGKQSDHPYY